MSDPEKDDGEKDRWKGLQTMSFMVSVPSGKMGYELYKGERERVLQRMLAKEEEATFKQKIARETDSEKRKGLEEQYAHSNWERHGKRIQVERELETGRE